MRLASGRVIGVTKTENIPSESSLPFPHNHPLNKPTGTYANEHVVNTPLESNLSEEGEPKPQYLPTAFPVWKNRLPSKSDHSQAQPNYILLHPVACSYSRARRISSRNRQRSCDLYKHTHAIVLSHDAPKLFDWVTHAPPYSFSNIHYFK